jgi:hypothetical protein
MSAKPFQQFGRYLALHQWALTQHRRHRADHWLDLVKTYAKCAAFAAKELSR